MLAKMNATAVVHYLLDQQGLRSGEQIGAVFEMLRAEDPDLLTGALFLSHTLELLKQRGITGLEQYEGLTFDYVVKTSEDILLGDFSEDPTAAAIAVRTLLTLIPGVDQLADIEDLSANVYKLAWQGRVNELGVWFGLTTSLLGAVPQAGSAIKGVLKLGGKGLVFITPTAVRKLAGSIDVSSWSLQLAERLREFMASRPSWQPPMIASFRSVLDQLEQLLLPMRSIASESVDRIRANLRTARDQAGEMIDQQVTPILDTLGDLAMGLSGEGRRVRWAEELDESAIRAATVERATVARASSAEGAAEQPVPAVVQRGRTSAATPGSAPSSTTAGTPVPPGPPTSQPVREITPPAPSSPSTVSKTAVGRPSPDIAGTTAPAVARGPQKKVSKPKEAAEKRKEAGSAKRPLSNVQEQPKPPTTPGKKLSEGSLAGEKAKAGSPKVERKPEIDAGSKAKPKSSAGKRPKDSAQEASDAKQAEKAPSKDTSEKGNARSSRPASAAARGTRPDASTVPPGRAPMAMGTEVAPDTAPPSPRGRTASDARGGARVAETGEASPESMQALSRTGRAARQRGRARAVQEEAARAERELATASEGLPPAQLPAPQQPESVLRVAHVAHGAFTLSIENGRVHVYDAGSFLQGAERAATLRELTDFIPGRHIHELHISSWDADHQNLVGELVRKQVRIEQVYVNAHILSGRKLVAPGNPQATGRLTRENLREAIGVGRDTSIRVFSHDQKGLATVELDRFKNESLERIGDIAGPYSLESGTFAYLLKKASETVLVETRRRGVRTIVSPDARMEHLKKLFADEAFLERVTRPEDAAEAIETYLYVMGHHLGTSFIGAGGTMKGKKGDVRDFLDAMIGLQSRTPSARHLVSISFGDKLHPAVPYLLTAAGLEVMPAPLELRGARIAIGEAMGIGPKDAPFKKSYEFLRSIGKDDPRYEIVRQARGQYIMDVYHAIDPTAWGRGNISVSAIDFPTRAAMRAELIRAAQEHIEKVQKELDKAEERLLQALK
jgi:hypothetical protein